MRRQEYYSRPHGRCSQARGKRAGRRNEAWQRRGRHGEGGLEQVCLRGERSLSRAASRPQRPPTWHIIARRTDSLPRAPAIPSPQPADSSSTRERRMRISPARCALCSQCVLPASVCNRRTREIVSCTLPELELLRGPVVSAPGEATGVLQLFCQRASPHQLSPPGASANGRWPRQASSTTSMATASC